MKLGDVMTLSKGNLIQIEDDKEYVIAGVQNYGAGILNKRKVKGFELTMKKYQVIKPNQLMWCKVDTKNGAFGVTKLEHTNSLASTNMALANIDTSKCHPEFIEYLFRIPYFHEIITKASSGTTNRKYLTPTQLFENIEMPDFNKEEQLRWLEKVDYVINSGISIELSHQLQLVKKLRQQLLQDAVQGKLVEQNPKDEPASELLKKIKAEKAKLIAEKKLKKEKELPPIKPVEIPFEIPENWVWCRLGDICNTITKGSSPNWQGVQYVDEDIGILFITSKNVDSFKIDLTKATYVEEKFNEIEPRSILKKGDLLTNIVGASIGRTALFDLDVIANINQAVCILRIEHDLINKDYLLNLMNSDLALKMMFESQFAPGRANLSMGNIASFTIPLPPLAEQNRIVQKLDELMQYCNELEVSIKQSESQNEKLLQQVLREALRKETVEG